MLKMIIRMNEEKIIMEKKYRLEGIYGTIDSAFKNMGLLRMPDESESMIYCDNGNERDYGRFGEIVNTLKKQDWFMDNVAAWLMYDSDDSDYPEDFNEEDLLQHYRKKQLIGA